MKKLLLTTFAAALLAANTFAQLTVTPTTNAATLAQSLAGNGVTITNAVLASGANGAGSFTAGNNTGLGISSGVVLSSGSILNIPQAASNFASNGNGGPTDADLSTLSNYTIDDAARLTFNITPLGNKLTFRYVFASEEYPEYVCSNFNDVFGFFITGPNPNGPAYASRNLATIPNTNTPVGINSINPGFPGSFGTSSQCVSTAYSSLYRDNSTNSTIVFDGMTVVLTATVDVIPCQTYSLKLAVGDATDDIYDSGVFLEGGSFVSNTATLTTAYSHANYTTTYEGCSSASVTFNFTAPYVGSGVFEYVVGGTATNGVDYQNLSGTVGVPAGASSATIDIIPNTDNNTEGSETVTISLFLPCSNQPYATTTVTINDVGQLTASANDSTLCPGQSATLTASGAVSYSWSPTTGLGSPTSASTSANPPGDFTYTVTGTTGNCTNTVDIPIQRSNLAINGTTSSVQCGNSSIDVTVLDGEPIFVYAWNDNVITEDRSNLSAGTYTITVTDKFGCTTSQSFVINQPPALTVSGTKTDINCFGGNSGSITTSVSGGAPIYTYLWSDNSTQVNRANLAPGTYSVTVTDANGCSGSASFTINQPSAPLSVVPQVTPTTCGQSDGSISLTVTGGTPNYSYAWTNTAQTKDIAGLAAGIYQVTVTDNNGCTAVVQSTVGSSAQFTVSAVPTSPSCLGINDGSIDVTVTGAVGNVSYVWNDNVQTEDRTGLSFGTYTVVVTDGSGCSASAQAVLAQPSAIQANATQTNVACNESDNGSISINSTGGNGGYSYLWNDQNTDSVRTGLAGGQYAVTITDARGCTTVRNFNITEPAVLVFTLQVTDATCISAIGSATVSPTGGTPGYNYIWSNPNLSGSSVSNLPAGQYAVTVSDSRGCTSAQAFTISTPNAITLAETHADVSCFGGNNGSIDITITGGTAPISFGWTDNVATEDRTGLVAGNYTITVSDVLGCSATLTVNIAEPQELTVSIAKTDVSCFGDSTGTLNATATGGTPIYTFAWSNQVSGAAQSGLPAGTYTVTVTDRFLCTATASATITEPQELLAQVAKTDVKCNGIADGTANITVTGGTPQYGFTWNVSGLTGASQTGLAAGNYDVTVSDAAGCTTFIIFIIEEDSAVSLTSSSTPASCNGAADGTATVIAAGGTGTYSYIWSNQGQSSTIQGLTSGSYTVTVTDGNGCSALENIFVNEPTAILITETHTDIACANATNGSIDLTVTGGNGGYQFIWADNNVITEDRSGLSAGTYIVVVADSKGCSATASVTIGSNTPPINISAVTVNVSCGGAKDGLIDVTVSGGAGQVSYLWNDNVVTQDRTALSGGTYTVTVTDTAGCTAQQSYTITESPALTLSAVATEAGCTGVNDGAINLTVSGGSPSYNFSWNDNVTTEDRTGLAAGSYSVTVSDASQCTASISAVVNQASPIQLAKQSTAVRCNGDATGAATITATGGTGNYNFVWNTAGVSGANPTNLAAGTYVVTVTDAGGCSSVTSVDITQPAAIVIVAAATPNICFGNSDGTALVTASGGIAPYNYSVVLVNSSNPVNRLDGDFLNLSAGNYIASVTDNNGCKVNTNFTVAAAPADSFNWNTTRTSCFGDTFNDGKISVEALTVDNAPFQYSFNGGTYTSQTEYDNLAAGTYVFTTKNAKGCTVNHQILVTQPAEINISFPAETLYVEMGHNTQLNANVQNAEGFNIVWGAEKSPSYLDFTCADCSQATPYTTTPFTNVYTVTVSDTANASCFRSGNITVVVANEIAVPNAFTPNGDNNNDRFYPVFNNKEVKLKEFRIYNRWGQIIYAETSEGWDGSYDSQLQPNGTYMYFLSYERLNVNTGEIEVKKKDGNFTLIR